MFLIYLKMRRSVPALGVVMKLNTVHLDVKQLTGSSRGSSVIVVMYTFRNKFTITNSDILHHNNTWGS